MHSREFLLRHRVAAIKSSALTVLLNDDRLVVDACESDMDAIPKDLLMSTDVSCPIAEVQLTCPRVHLCFQF